MFSIGCCRGSLIGRGRRSRAAGLPADWLGPEVRLWGDAGRPAAAAGRPSAGLAHGQRRARSPPPPPHSSPHLRAGTAEPRLLGGLAGRRRREPGPVPAGLRRPRRPPLRPALICRRGTRREGGPSRSPRARQPMGGLGERGQHAEPACPRRLFCQSTHGPAHPPSPEPRLPLPRPVGGGGGGGGNRGGGGRRAPSGCGPLALSPRRGGGGGERSSRSRRRARGRRVGRYWGLGGSRRVAPPARPVAVPSPGAGRGAEPWRGGGGGWPHPAAFICRAGAGGGTGGTPSFKIGAINTAPGMGAQPRATGGP